MNSVSLERRGRNLLARLISFLFPLKSIQTSELHSLLSHPSTARIIIIRPHQGLGDLLLATPAFRALKKRFPQLKIHFLADTYNEIAIRHNPSLDRLWIWDKKRMQNPFSFWSFIRSLRAEKFTVAIPMSSHVPSFTSYMLARLCGAKGVIAYDTTAFYDGATWSRHLAQIVVPNLPEEEPEWVKFMELVKPLVGDQNDIDYSPDYATDPVSEAWAAQEWRKISIPAGKKKIGLFFGGNPDRPERLWPADYWKQLAMDLQKVPDVALVAIVPPADFLSGSRALESGIYPQIAPYLDPAPPVVSHPSLVHMAAFLKGLDLFVCVDGGIFHVAVGARVRTLGLFFKTDPARWKPPVEWATVLRPADDLPVSLSPAEVYHKVEEMVLKSKTTISPDRG